jgi:hypothetical protein
MVPNFEKKAEKIKSPQKRHGWFDSTGKDVFVLKSMSNSWMTA